MNKRRLAFVLLFAAWAALTWKVKTLEPKSGENFLPPTGSAAPAFTLKDVAGNAVSLADFRGKTVVLNFWATWCGPCREEMPHFSAFHEANAENNIVVVGVSSGEKLVTVRTFLEKKPVAYPILLDSDSSVTKLYRVSAYPTTFIVDAAGAIRASRIGGIDNLHGAFADLWKALGIPHEEKAAVSAPEPPREKASP